MAEAVLMPKAGITVEECIITEWLKKKGDKVDVGEVLFTYETDKATFECESTAAGELLEILSEEGDEVPVLQAVCVIGQPGESVTELLDSKNSADEVLEVKEAARITEPQSGQNLQTTAEYAMGQVKISPRAKMTAAVLDVNPACAAPTGPGGRIIEKDIRSYAQGRAGESFGGLAKEEGRTQVKPSEEPAGSSRQNVSIEEYEDVKFSGVRKATAKAMVNSLSTMAQLTHQHSFDATTIMRLREQLKQQRETLGITNITLNDMVLFAVSRVLLNHPDLNANMVQTDVIRRFEHVHLGMAVDTPRGLLVPVIRYADRMSLEQISIEARRLIILCKEGKAGPDTFAQGTFTVSNLGSLGVEMFTPVINPPQTGILGVCGITTKVKGVDGVLSGYPAMGLSLTYDHRAVDGAPASRFAKELCTALENLDLILMK